MSIATEAAGAGVRLENMATLPEEVRDRLAGSAALHLARRGYLLTGYPLNRFRGMVTLAAGVAAQMTAEYGPDLPFGIAFSRLQPNECNLPDSGVVILGSSRRERADLYTPEFTFLFNLALENLGLSPGAPDNRQH